MAGLHISINSRKENPFKILKGFKIPFSKINLLPGIQPAGADMHLHVARFPVFRTV